jgi:VWFA-related protein
MKLTRLLLALTVSLALHAQQTLPTSTTPARPRLLCMFFDLNALDAAAQSKARDSAIQFVQTQATPSDLISVMTYTSQVNVLQDFTDSHDGILAALRTIMPSDAGNNGAGNGVAGPEFDILATDRQLSAIQAAVRILAAFPEKKAMLYFSSGIARNGIDNQAQLHAATNAAIRANVSIYSVDSRGLVPAPPR